MRRSEGFFDPIIWRLARFDARLCIWLRRVELRVWVWVWRTRRFWRFS
jgi:hypothetical protein